MRQNYYLTNITIDDNIYNNIDLKRYNNIDGSNYKIACPLGCESSSALDKDINYFKQLYPITVKAVQLEVSNICDNLDYNGSFMYDDEPSKKDLTELVNYAYITIRSKLGLSLTSSNDLAYTSLRDLITVLTYNEFIYRRRIYRRINL